MEAAMDRLTRLVYGAGSSSNTTSTIHNSTSTTTAAAPTKTTKNAPSHPWKPAGNARVSTGSRGQGNARAACSPIGINGGMLGNPRGLGKEVVSKMQGGRVNRRTG